jgi:hypothetical protein
MVNEMVIIRIRLFFSPHIITLDATNCKVACTFNSKRSFTRVGKWQECD